MSITAYDTKGTSQYAARAVINAINNGAVALIGASTSATAQTAQYVSQVYKIPQLGYAATSPDLSSRSEYPFFARVVPSDINQSGALAEIVNRFNWPEVSVIASDDSLGRGGANTFINFLTGYGKVVLVNVALSATNSDQESIDLAVDRLKASGARVFYINMFDTLAKKVFKSAAAKGIMGPRYVWLASGSVLKPNLFKNSTGQIDDPEYKASLNGVLGCNLWPGGGPAFDQFSADWLALDPLQYPGAGTSSFSFYVPYAYDAVFTYAHAFATMINQGMDYTNGTALLEVLGNTMFEGLTGNITLSLGERTTAKYDIMNIVDGSSSYIKVGQWDSINGLALNGTPAIIWPDGTTNPPYIPSVFEPVPPTYTSVEYSDSIVIVLIVLTTLLAVAIVIVAIVIGVFYKHHVVADTNVVYNLILLAGLFFCCFMLYPFFNDPNDASCAIRPWVLLPFMFVYLVIVHKLYVILIQRFTAKDEEKKVTLRVKYHWWSLPILLGTVLSLEVMYLAIWTGADRPYPQNYATFNTNEETALCQSDNHWVWISIQATYIAMLVIPGIVGSMVVWLFRVNTMWNEGRYIASTILVLSIWIIMFIVPAYVVRANPKAWIGLLGFGVWTSLVIVLVLLFGSRIFFLVKSLLKEKKETEKRKGDAEWRPTVSEGGSKDDMLDEL